MKKRRIFRQKNGLYAVFSTVINNVVYNNATREEIINEYFYYPVIYSVPPKKQEIINLVDSQLEEADNKDALKRALDACRTTNGDREYKRVLKIINDI